MTAVAFCGRQILSGSADKTLKLRDPSHADDTAVATFRGHTGGVTALACSADGRIAFSGGAEPDDNLRAWDVPARKLIHSFGAYTDSVAAVALFADGVTGVAGTADGTVRLWDVVKGEQKHTLGERGQSVTAVALSPDASRVLCGTLGGDLRLQSVEAPARHVHRPPGGDHFDGVQAPTAAWRPPVTPTAPCSCGTPLPDRKPAGPENSAGMIRS